MPTLHKRKLLKIQRNILPKKDKKMNKNISTVLKAVSKPGRYSGGEYGQIIKDKEKVKGNTIDHIVEETSASYLRRKCHEKFFE